MSDTSGGDFNETAVPAGGAAGSPRPEGDRVEGASGQGVSVDAGNSARSEAGAKKPSGQKKKKKVVQLGDFRLVKKLGQGGMGEVYLAKQISLDRLVALKVLSKELAKKKGFVDRFVREADISGDCQGSTKRSRFDQPDQAWGHSMQPMSSPLSS